MFFRGVGTGVELRSQNEWDTPVYARSGAELVVVSGAELDVNEVSCLDSEETDTMKCTVGQAGDLSFLGKTAVQS